MRTVSGCCVNPSLSVSLSDGQFMSSCQSDCASLHHNGVRRSGVYNIVLTPGTTLPVYCDMETEGETHTVHVHTSYIVYYVYATGMMGVDAFNCICMNVCGNKCGCRFVLQVGVGRCSSGGAMAL